MPRTATLDEKRLARVTTLKSGSHAKPNGEFEACVMEAVAYVSGQPWSDHPACVCPVITAFMVSWNDSLPSDEERTRLLLPLIPKLIGTRDSKALANRRATMAADWLVRVHTPTWLRLAGLTAEADALANLPEIIDFAQTPSIMGPLQAASRAASNVRAAAWAAARAAAWDAARDAARAAARDAARDAARAAARDAARDAARAAARDALKPTTETLQVSALKLVERMCDLKETV
jgi:hypothetical protein